VHRISLRRHIRPRHISPVKAAIAAGVAVVAAGTALFVVSHRSTNTPVLTGTWTGSYICSQGLTGLRLVIQATRDGTLTGTFNFYALPANPGVPSGEATVTGTYSATTTDINPGHWIRQPSGYVLVGLIAGAPTDNGTLLRGRISNPGCSTFSITKSLWRGFRDQGWHHRSFGKIEFQWSQSSSPANPAAAWLEADGATVPTALTRKYTGRAPLCKSAARSAACARVKFPWRRPEPGH